MIKERVYEFARFVRHLPTYYWSHVLFHQQVIRAQRDPSFRDSHIVFVSRDVFIVAPEDVTACTTWKYVYATPAGKKEIEMFLRLRQGCRRFLDVGAAEGSISAIFARTATEPSRIVAVEPADRLYPLHEEVIGLNLPGKQGIVDWSVHKLALLDKCQDLNYGAAEFGDCFSSRPRDVSNPLDGVKVMTLEAFCDSLNFEPDLIKIDIESFEYEVLMSSLPYLKRVRPRIHLELHLQLLQGRGRSSNELLAALEQYYVIERADPKHYGASELVRMALVPK